MRSNEPLYLQLNNVLTNEIVTSNYHVDDQFFTERKIADKYKVSTKTAKVIGDVESEVIREGYSLEFFFMTNTDERNKILYSKLIGKKVKGIFLVSMVLDEEIILKASSQDIPTVLINGPAGNGNICMSRLMH